MSKDKREKDLWYKLIFEDGTEGFINHPDISPQDVLSSQVKEKYLLHCRSCEITPKKIKSIRASSYQEYIANNEYK